MKPPMIGVSMESADCTPNMALVTEAASSGGERSISQEWITGRIAYMTKPNTETQAT